MRTQFQGSGGVYTSFSIKKKKQKFPDPPPMKFLLGLKKFLNNQEKILKSKVKRTQSGPKCKPYQKQKERHEKNHQEEEQTRKNLPTLKNSKKWEKAKGALISFTPRRMPPGRTPASRWRRGRPSRSRRGTGSRRTGWGWVAARRTAACTS